MATSEPATKKTLSKPSVRNVCEAEKLSSWSQVTAAKKWKSKLSSKNTVRGLLDHSLQVATTRVKKLEQTLPRNLSSSQESYVADHVLPEPHLIDTALSLANLRGAINAAEVHAGAKKKRWSELSVYDEAFRKLSDRLAAFTDFLPAGETEAPDSPQQSSSPLVSLQNQEDVRRLKEIISQITHMKEVQSRLDQEISRWHDHQHHQQQTQQQSNTPQQTPAQNANSTPQQNNESDQALAHMLQTFSDLGLALQTLHKEREELEGRIGVTNSPPSPVLMTHQSASPVALLTRRSSAELRSTPSAKDLAERAAMEKLSRLLGHSVVDINASGFVEIVGLAILRSDPLPPIEWDAEHPAPQIAKNEDDSDGSSDSSAVASSSNSRTLQEKMKSGVCELQQGSEWRVRVRFVVSQGGVRGLRCLVTTKKAGVTVSLEELALGSFFPRDSPYEWVSSAFLTPKGLLVQGKYTNSLEFSHDDEPCVFQSQFVMKIC